MIITAVQLKILFDTGTKLRAIANLTLDDMIVIHDIKVLMNNGELFLAMPSKSKKISGFQDIVHPINRDTRTAIEKIIFAVYDTAIKENRALIDVRMIVDEEDSVITQSSAEFEIVSSIISEKKTLETAVHSERVVKQNINMTSGESDFIRWLKK